MKASGAIVRGQPLAIGVYRYVVEVDPCGTFGLQWLSEGAGTATHKIYVSSATHEILRRDTDPSTNLLWQENIQLQFLAEPAGAPASVRPLTAGCHGWCAVLVELDVTVALERYSLFATVGRC